MSQYSRAPSISAVNPSAPATGVVAQKKHISGMKNWYTLTQSEAQQSWQKLEQAFEHIYNKNYSTLSFEELHRFVI